MQVGWCERAGFEASVRGQRRARARGLAGDPALRNFAHEAVRIRVAGDVPAAGDESVQRCGHQAAVRDRNVRKFGRYAGADADFVVNGRRATVVQLREMCVAKQLAKKAELTRVVGERILERRRSFPS